MIGNGMAGVACLENILKLPNDLDITVFGDETYPNYNRIMLSSVLAGEREADNLTINGIDWYQKNRIGLRLGVRITAIDRKKRIIRGDDGSVTEYDKLIIATGSSPVIPAIEGIGKSNVFTFRTLDDTRGMIAAAREGARAVVIGGGILGLEAARGLQLRGCEVTVVQLKDSLMNRQLDATASGHLRDKIEQLGIQVLAGRTAAAIQGDNTATALTFTNGEVIPADIIIIAAGIQPNAWLGRDAGLACNRGIIVNGHMQTSDPRIYALGECTEFNGETWGLIAPLHEQGRVLAAVITGHPTEPFQSSAAAAKLKITGLDVFSAGEYLESEGTGVVKYEDAPLGIYKKLLIRNNRLVGVVLVGDDSDSSRYMNWFRNNTDLLVRRKNLLFPEPVSDRGEVVAEIADAETVCGCLGVTKAQIIQAIHEKGVNSLVRLKETTRASTGCGSCTGTCQSLLKAVAPDFEADGNRVLCQCVPYSDDHLRGMIRTQRLRSVQEVLDIYGDGQGCEVCKPALSYLVDVVWAGDHNEDPSARFINDRVHANIQKDGTFSVIPRIRGGVTSPVQLRKIAEVAEKYNVRMVKITGSQRIDLLGVQKQDLPKIWEDLGMPSGQAYTKGVRMVKTCVGTQFCRFGVKDAIAAGIELEKRFENLYTPHKTKMAVAGCPRNCSEATVKDIGLVGQEGSWQVVVGGAAGKSVRKADLLVTVVSTEEALEAAALFFQYYRENANYLERSYDFVQRLGMEKIRKDTVYAQPPVRKGLLQRLQKAKMLAKDAWLDRYDKSHRGQFVQIEPAGRLQ